MPWHVCGCHRTTYESCFSLSILWVPESNPTQLPDAMVVTRAGITRPYNRPLGMKTGPCLDKLRDGKEASLQAQEKPAQMAANADLTAPLTQPAL